MLYLSISNKSTIKSRIHVINGRVMTDDKVMFLRLRLICSLNAISVWKTVYPECGWHAITNKYILLFRARRIKRNNRMTLQCTKNSIKSYVPQVIWITGKSVALPRQLFHENTMLYHIVINYTFDIPFPFRYIIIIIVNTSFLIF